MRIAVADADKIAVHGPPILFTCVLSFSPMPFPSCSSLVVFYIFILVWEASRFVDIVIPKYPARVDLYKGFEKSKCVLFEVFFFFPSNPIPSRKYAVLLSSFEWRLHFHVVITYYVVRVGSCSAENELENNVGYIYVVTTCT